MNDNNKAKVRAFLEANPGREFETKEIALAVGITKEQASDTLPMLYLDGVADKRKGVKNRRLWKLHERVKKEDCPFHKFVMQTKARQ